MAANALRSEYGYEKTIFTPSEVDDILGHFEGADIYRSKGLLDDDTIYEASSYYVLIFHENKQMAKFIEYPLMQDNLERQKEIQSHLSV